MLKSDEQEKTNMVEEITEEKWQAWTNAVLEWGEDFDSHLETLQNAPEGQFDIDAEEMEDNWASIQKDIGRGNRQPHRRNKLKDRIQKAGSEFPNWPHRRGAGSSLTVEQQAALEKVEAIAHLEATARYQVYVENNATHLLVKRASSANNTLGVAYENEAEFVEAQVKSIKAQYRGFLRDGIWGQTDEEGNTLPFAFEQPIVRPIPTKKED